MRSLILFYPHSARNGRGQTIKKQAQGGDSSAGKQEKKSLKSNVLKYAIVNSFLVALNLFTFGRIGWAIYPLLFWGLGIALDSWVIYQSESEEYDKQFQKWLRKQKRDQLTAQITGKLTTSLEEWLK
jgi:hypothetical protein